MEKVGVYFLTKMFGKQTREFSFGLWLVLVVVCVHHLILMYQSCCVILVTVYSIL
jgi:hypothetical protein